MIRRLMLLKFVNLFFYWKTKKATLLLGYILGEQTPSKCAKQKECFKLRRLMLLTFVNLLFYWKPKKPTQYSWTFLERGNPFKMAKKRKICFRFIGLFLFSFFYPVESLTVVSNYWSWKLRERKLKFHRASVAKPYFIQFKTTAQIQS